MQTLGTTETIPQTPNAGSPNQPCQRRSGWSSIALTVAAVVIGAALIFAGMAIALGIRSKPVAALAVNL